MLYGPPTLEEHNRRAALRVKARAAVEMHRARKALEQELLDMSTWPQSAFTRYDTVDDLLNAARNRAATDEKPQVK
jgi:hypothetical protein